MKNNSNDMGEACKINDYPKVLIFEHPPMNKEGIGKTLYSFFGNWDRERLGQVYSVDLPLDYSLCKYYYYPEIVNRTEVDDSRKSREKRRNSFGFKILANLAHSNLGTIIRSYRYKRIKRDCADLKKWIDEFSPDVFFVGIGENVNENLFILELAQEKNIPIILYASDDYMTKWRKRGVYAKYGEMLYKSYKKLVSNSILFVVISDKMKRLYEKEFSSIKYFVASNSARCKRNIIKRELKDEIHFVYTGNLGLGRWQMLKKIADYIRYFNSNNNECKLYLSIYSQEMPELRILNKITNEYSTYKSNVVGRELDRVRGEADVLLLVESFDTRYREILSTAFSTKVSEYLSYGKIILAWAPDYAGSLEYLNCNKAAFCITSDKMENDLKKFVTQFCARQLDEIVKNGNKLFDEKHEFVRNAEKFADCVKLSLKCYFEKGKKGELL